MTERGKGIAPPTHMSRTLRILAARCAPTAPRHRERTSRSPRPMAVAAEAQGDRMLNAQQLMWTQIAAGIAVLLFGLTLFNLARMWGRMQAARSWDRVEGIITVSRVDQPAAHASDDRND